MREVELEVVDLAAPISLLGVVVVAVALLRMVVVLTVVVRLSFGTSSTTWAGRT